MVKKTATALIVDDNPITLDSIGLIFQMIGETVEKVKDGESALKMLKSFKPKVVVLDIAMGQGKMDGIEVCRQIKSNESHKGISVIFLTGREDKKDRDKAIAAGADAYILKPFNPQDLKMTLKKAYTS